MSLDVLEPYPNFSRDVGYLFSGMEEVRAQLREAIEGLDDQRIGRPAFPGAHSIGALVLHIGEAEWWWMQCIVSGHKLTEEDRRAPYWDVLKDPEGFAARGHNAAFCLEQIDAIRGQTRELLSTWNDKDLERICSFERKGERHDHSLRWVLHHLIDHEAQHKGQVLMLKRLWV